MFPSFDAGPTTKLKFPSPAVDGVNTMQRITA